VWPPKPGQLVILLGEPRGFVGLLLERKLNTCKVRLLDSELEPIDYHVEQLIATGHTPEDIVAKYKPTDIQLSHSLDVERSLPDFERLQKKSTKTKAKREKKPLTEVQLMFLKRLLVDKLKAAGIKLKETK